MRRWADRPIYRSVADWRRICALPVDQMSAEIKARVRAYDPPAVGLALDGRSRVEMMDDGELLNWAGWDRLKMPSYYVRGEQIIRHEASADWQNVDPQLVRLAGAVLRWFDKIEVPLWVHSAFRTELEQEALLRRGVSKARFPNAPHCQGAAIDLIHARYAWDLTPGEWFNIAAVVRMCWFKISPDEPLVWGGSWVRGTPTADRVGWDPAHYELRNWRDWALPGAQIHTRDPVRMTRAALYKAAALL